MSKRPLLIIAALLILTGGLTLRQVLLSARAVPQPAIAVPGAYPPPTATNRIAWGGGTWYLHGVNVPWYNWGCDFGCNPANGKTGGVSTNLPTLATAFGRMRDAGMHIARWWVFPGDPAQILRDASGAPTGLDPAIYADIDAALDLAEQFDIAYDFVLFSAPTHIPAAWQTDPLQRARLIDALSPLFARYAHHPRIFSWEPYNEPENDIWSFRIAQQPVVDTGTAITQSVHTNAPGTYVTIGHFKAEGMRMWRDAGLDYYAPHWYDYMWGDNCLICHDEAYYAAWGIDKPIIVGEYFTGTAKTSPHRSADRLSHWYASGYAGAWAWSLFPAQTSDRMAVDLAAAATFATQHDDIGPTTQGR
jgi:hypothetical protein